MNTLERSLQELEYVFGGKYYEDSFPNSELRKNSEEIATFIKSQLESLLKIKDKKIAANCITMMEEYVAGSENIGKSRLRGDNMKHFAEEGIKYCDIILTRIAEYKPQQGDKLTVNDLNEKYKHKFLCFNGDEDGEKIAFVTNIHYNKKHMLVMDGTIIDLCNENHENGDGVLIYEVEDYDFDRFWYFDGFSSTDELDEALQSQPCDTNYPTHIISAKEVASSIIASIRWGIEYKTRHIWLTKIFEYLEATIEEDIKEKEDDTK